jgi:hypothetical protein
VKRKEINYNKKNFDRKQKKYVRRAVGSDVCRATIGMSLYCGPRKKKKPKVQLQKIYWKRRWKNNSK